VPISVTRKSCVSGIGLRLATATPDPLGAGLVALSTRRPLPRTPILLRRGEHIRRRAAEEPQTRKPIGDEHQQGDDENDETERLKRPGAEHDRNDRE
jgi:hypothetical protein